MKNILTVDLEDWFSVEVFNTVIPREAWLELPSVVRRNTDDILELFTRYKTRATFFVLGWIAEHHPDLVTQIHEAGHEIACHSYHHCMVNSLDAETFREDTERAISAIRKACGVTPRGYRSPSWGMNADLRWAFEVLIELGFLYDSSIFPVAHDIYGDPGSPVHIHDVRLGDGKSITEVPASSVTLFGRRIPVAGGGWLRQFPFWFTRWAIRRINRLGRPAVVYFHPWELDPRTPRHNLGIRNYIRQYGNLASMRGKVSKLLSEFEFVPIGTFLSSHRVSSSQQEPPRA